MQALFVLGILVLMAIGYTHIALYRRAIFEIEARGTPVTAYKTNFFNYGSGGCIRNIKRLKQQHAGALTDKEAGLLEKSIWAYYFGLVFFSLLQHILSGQFSMVLLADRSVNKAWLSPSAGTAQKARRPNTWRYNHAWNEK